MPEMDGRPAERTVLRQPDQRIRTVAIHVTGDPEPFLKCGADRYWVGVRGSVSEFLELASDGTIASWLSAAGRTRRKVGLVTPYCVDAARFDQVISAIADFSVGVDRVMTGDFGVASRISDAVRTYLVAAVNNVDHAIFLRRLGIHGVRAIRPVSTGAMDVNREIDLEMPVFGRLPIAFMPECDRGSVGDAPVELHGRGGGIILCRGYAVTSDYLDLSDSLRPFGRDTVGVVETFGLTPDEVAEAVDAIRFGRPVETNRPLFVSEQD